MDLTQPIGVLMTTTVEAGVGSLPKPETTRPKRVKEIRAIRQRRRKLGVTQLTLAKRAGISEIKVSRLECGREALPPNLADKLAAALDSFSTPGDRRPSA